MRQCFLSKNGNIPPLMLLKEHYLLRFSLETGAVKKRTRKETNSPQSPSNSQGLWEKLLKHCSPHFSGACEVQVNWASSYQVQTEESEVEGRAWGAQHRASHSSLCQVADAENGDKHGCATNSFPPASPSLYRQGFKDPVVKYRGKESRGLTSHEEK